MTYRLEVQDPPVVMSRAQIARLDAHHAYFTPQGATLICYLAIRDYLEGRVDLSVATGEILDPTAGPGGFGWAARKLFPGVSTAGNELRPEEAEGLAANYDSHTIGPFQDVEAEASLVLTNPPFNLAVEFWECGDRFVRVGGWIFMLVRLTLGDSVEAAEKIWESSRRPDVVIEFSNRFRLREGINPESGKAYGSDSVTYRLLGRQRVDPEYAELGVEPLNNLAPMEMHKIPRLHDDLFRRILGSGGQRIEPGSEWRVDDDAAEARVVELALKEWARARRIERGILGGDRPLA